MNTEKKKRHKGAEKKFCRAVGTVAAIVDCVAGNMKDSLDGGGNVDTKQLKELTSTLKELSAVIDDLHESSEESKNTLTVLFEGEGQEWAM